MKPKVIGLASLFEPLEFLEHRIENLNRCDMDGVLIWFCDCSDEQTQAQARAIIKAKCSFNYKFTGLVGKRTLYWVWNHLVTQCILDSANRPDYLCAVNVDDVQAPNYFKLLSGFLDDHPEVKIVTPQWYATKTKGSHWPAPQDAVFVDPDVTKTLGHFPMWRLTLHEQVGNFNPLLMVVGDSDFWDRIKKRWGYEGIAVIEQAVAMYLDHEKNLYKTARRPNGQTGEAWDRKQMGIV